MQLNTVSHLCIIVFMPIKGYDSHVIKLSECCNPVVLTVNTTHSTPLITIPMAGTLENCGVIFCNITQVYIASDGQLLSSRRQ